MKTDRITKQRTAIADVIARANRPLNVPEIWTEAAKSVPELGIATVYRNIKTMLEHGEIVPICGSGIAPCYVSPLVAARRLGPIYQIGNSLYFDPPSGFHIDRHYDLNVGHVA